MKRLVSLLCAVAILAGLLTGLSGCRNDDNAPLAFPTDGSLVQVIVGATPRPHAEILAYIAPRLRAEGIELIIQEFTDFHAPNPALFEGQLHANYFQHVPFLNAYITNTGNYLHVVGPIHVEPMGAYSLTLDNINDIPQNGTVAIPGDATNGGRALLLLQQAGLITIDPAAGILATRSDITYNPRNLEILDFDAAMLPRVLMASETDVSIVNTNHLIAADTGLCPVNDSLVREPTFGNPYANVLVVREENADSPVIAALLRHLQSEAVRAFIYRNYTGVEPVF